MGGNRFTQAGFYTPNALKKYAPPLQPLTRTSKEFSHKNREKSPKSQLAVKEGFDMGR